MAVLLSLFFYLLLVPNSATSKCSESFQCGHFSLGFPFFSQDPGCGMFNVSGCNITSEFPTLHVGQRWGYHIINKTSAHELKILDLHLSETLNGKCFPLSNASLPHTPSVSFTITSPLASFFRCINQTSNPLIQQRFHNYSSLYKEDCGPSTLYYYTDSPAEEEINIPKECGMIQPPINNRKRNSSQVLEALTAEFIVKWNVSQDCYDCYHGGWQCTENSMNEFRCNKGHRDPKLILATCIPAAAILLILLLASFMIWQRKRKLRRNYLLRSTSSDPSRSDIEDGSSNLGILIFSYTELVEATSNFDPSKELGDGGFGTVYHGKLQDGREVAIKRLYEHNYRRVEQFLNEIKILNSLRHPNLVSLYGCTSRRSRELLLVYEYIPNGTVADHLHGERAKKAPLKWPVRMNIARETASALAYLHKSEVIHRDVKTNNILLDKNFSVKVADFGLSRLFPLDVTHISTAPQGIPGYVDPEYHQCYQLTDKSDVYSFGVVLVELISSMPAVDINRCKHEVNLANLAVNRIQKCAFDELIDPSTGYNSDPEVTRMTTTVAELALRCLQLEKDLRPSMEEVVVFLRDIHDGGDGNNGFGKIPPSPETDEAVLLKSKNYQSSPTAVTDTWISCNSTTASSVD